MGICEVETTSRVEETSWIPEVPRWEPEISLTESQGGKARLLWQENLAELAEIPSKRMQLLFTGIGGGVASVEKAVGVRRHGDGAEIVKYVDLETEYGEVPEVLFLVASASTADNVLGLTGLAKEYKEQGVRAVIAVLTALAHERQDHQFYDDRGIPIQELTMLEGVINVLTGEDEIERLIADETRRSKERCLDAGLIIQPHSLRSVELAGRQGFPLLPIDALPLLMTQAGFEQIPQEQRFVLGPDKGRKSAARRWASFLRCRLATADKTRERTVDGYPTVRFPPEALKYMREHNCILLAPDDEVREGGTLFEVAKEGQESGAQELRVCVVKLIAAGKAVERLQHPLITQIMTTNAVQPLTDISPIGDKLKVISLEPEIKSLVAYLKRNLIPREENWLRDPSQTGTLLELDLRIERY